MSKLLSVAAVLRRFRVHYAFVDGHGAPEFVGTLDEVEVKLGIRAATPAPASPVASAAARSCREHVWDVRLTFRYPAWDEVDGVWYRGIVASSKSAANAMARKMAAGDGHLCGGKGRATFIALESDSPR